jgi:D-lyxose ketol-isomerase
MHFHWHKTEDIINRGGGQLALQLYNSTEDEDLAPTDVNINRDGIKHTIKAGETVLLNPGESITLPTLLYHQFWGVNSPVLVGEVSLVNDDKTDNRFHESVGRFPKIEEDEPPLHLLVNDYEQWVNEILVGRKKN